MKYLIALLLICSLSILTQAQDQAVFFVGKAGKIVYNMNNGKYSVYVNDKVVFKDIYASFDGQLADTLTYPRQMIRSIDPVTGDEVSNIIVTKNGRKLIQQIITKPDEDVFYTRLIIEGEGVVASRMKPFICDQLATNVKQTMIQVPFDNDAWIRYHAFNLADTAITSAEVTSVFSPGSGEGWVIGSLEHEVWKTGIEVGGNRIVVVAGWTDSTITRDIKSHGTVTAKNKRVVSPLILVSPASNWKKGLEFYAAANLKAEPRYIKVWTAAKPFGWNSWGVIQSKLTLDKAKKVIDYFADSCRQFRNADNKMFIDLDSYWDNLSPGGAGGDFSKLVAFSKYCKEKGLIPGIYWAPFVDWGKHPRKVEGSDDNYENVWTKADGKYCDLDGARAMDPTHPATKARIKYLIDRFKSAGFEMIKIDFLGHAAIEADSFYDPEVKTGMQAFRKGMEWLTDQLENKMLVYAAISPNLATARYTHMRRIACDAYRDINETAYTLNGTSYGWWLNGMYDFLDADHVVLDGVSVNMNRARMASALVTGSIVLGDDYSVTSGKEQIFKILQKPAFLKLAKDKAHWLPADQAAGKVAANIFCRPGAIAIINYGNEANVTDLAKYLPSKIVRLNEVFSGKNIIFDKNKRVTVPAADAVILTWK